MQPHQSRRAFLGSLATAAGATLAGCRSPGSAVDSGSSAGEGGSSVTETAAEDGERTSTVAGRYADVYDDVAPSIASVTVFDGSGGSSQGSAFVYDGGHLITNEHVVSDAEEVSVRFESTGWRPASVVATDVYSDLAALEVPNLPSAASPLSFVAEDPPVGTAVVAIGNPFGYSGSVSAGIISGVDRALPAANGFSIADAVQTDAAVNPGNSGGPLVTLDGDVVGVVNAGGGDNIGFAVSAALVQRVVPALLRSGNYEHSYVGVTLRPVTPTIAEANPLPVAHGVYIDRVVDGGPSDGVLRGSSGSQTVDGVRTPVGGDVVVGMNETTIPTRQALSTFLALETSPGDGVDVHVIRGGERRTVELELGSRPAPNR